MELVPQTNLLEKEINQIESEYPSDYHKIKRQADIARTKMAEGFSIEVCIASLRKHFPPPGPRIHGRRPGTPKRRPHHR